MIAVALATAWSTRERSTPAPAPSAEPMRGSPASSPHAGFEAQDGKAGGALRGDAPWALSALPDCLIQRSQATGPLAFVRSKLPAGATVVPPGSVLHYGPCTISVRDGEAIVSRGPDVLRIPPRATLYRTAQKLALLRTSGNHGDLRIYSPPKNTQ